MCDTLLCSANGNNLAIGNAESLRLTGRSFSVLVWVNIARHNIENQGDNTILGSNQTLSYSCLHLVIRNGCPYMGFYGNDTSSSEQLQLQTWYHLAYVYDVEEQTQSIFINGRLSCQNRDRPALRGQAEIYVSEYAGARGLNGR